MAGCALDSGRGAVPAGCRWWRQILTRSICTALIVLFCGCEALVLPTAADGGSRLESITTRLGDFDVTLGFVFEANSSLVDPVNFYNDRIAPRVNRNRNTPVPFATRANNYSVLDECAAGCARFVSGNEWNGSRCDAWTVTVIDPGLPAALFECTFYEFSDLKLGPGVPIDTVCSGCGTGVVHKTWTENIVYSVIFVSIVALHVLHLIAVAVRYRDREDLREFLTMTIETFLPATFAVVEMAESACSLTQEFLPTLLIWMIVVAIPEKIFTSVQIQTAVKAEQLFEALKEHKNAKNAGSVGVSVNVRETDDDDVLLLEDTSWRSVTLPTQIERLQSEHDNAEKLLEAYEPAYQYHRGANGFILLHLYWIVRSQASRSSAALLFLFFGFEHVIPVGIYVLVTLGTASNRRKFLHGCLRFVGEALSWTRTKRWMLFNLLTNRTLGMIVSMFYTTYFLHVVLVDYATTSGSHVTCMPLLPWLDSPA